MARRSLTHASSHINVMHQKSNFKEEIGIKDSLIHQKASNLINPFILSMQQVLIYGRDLIGQKFQSSAFTGINIRVCT